MSEMTTTTCSDGTHRSTCECGAGDPDDARDRAREREWDGESNG
jgi:hypothetical protein